MERIAAGLRGGSAVSCAALAVTSGPCIVQKSGFPLPAFIKVPILLALAADVDAGRHRWDEVAPSGPEETADSLKPAQDKDSRDDSCSF